MSGPPRFTISAHAEAELVRRRIPHSMLMQVLEQPQQIVGEHSGRKAYQSRVKVGGRTFLPRAIVRDDLTPPIVVTVYRTSKIGKYWSGS
jgi:hypothetical protein